jgi:hypothetical protein
MNDDDVRCLLKATTIACTAPQTFWDFSYTKNTFNQRNEGTLCIYILFSLVGSFYLLYIFSFFLSCSYIVCFFFLTGEFFFRLARKHYNINCFFFDLWFLKIFNKESDILTDASFFVLETFSLKSLKI